MDALGVQCSVRYPVTIQKFPVTQSRYPVEDVPRKFPVTQEHMAVHLGLKRANTLPVHEVFPDSFYENVSNLVFKMARKYVDTCYGATVEDLAQDCWYRIVFKLHTFNPAKAMFTTWCWKVCSSVLNKGYQRTKKRTSHLAEMPDGLDENRIPDENTKCPTLSFEMRKAISDLRDLYPDDSEILTHMFGDIGPDGALEHTINLSGTAKASGVSLQRVTRFYHDVVKPFFIERFKEA